MNSTSYVVLSERRRNRRVGINVLTTSHQTMPRKLVIPVVNGAQYASYTSTNVSEMADETKR